MFTVYIINSTSRNKYYIGQTNNLKHRLIQHNSGYSIATKSGIPWELVFKKEFVSRSDAYQYEQKIKKMKSKGYLEELISAGRASR
jgi:putative endonuclease